MFVRKGFLLVLSFNERPRPLDRLSITPLTWPSTLMLDIGVKPLRFCWSITLRLALPGNDLSSLYSWICCNTRFTVSDNLFIWPCISSLLLSGIGRTGVKSCAPNGLVPHAFPDSILLVRVLTWPVFLARSTHDFSVAASQISFSLFVICTSLTNFSIGCGCNMPLTASSSDSDRILVYSRTMNSPQAFRCSEILC